MDDTLTFVNAKAWRTWLKKNGGSTSVAHLVLAKVGSELRTLSYQQALEEALCFGWIDGKKRSHTADAWIQTFTPRAKRSIWSKINRDKALALIAKGKMEAPGLREVERAKEDGRWDRAYDSAKTATVPPDLASALRKNAKANSFFETLNGANRYAILFRIQTVRKAETRARKIAEFVAMLARGEKLHP